MTDDFWSLQRPRHSAYDVEAWSSPGVLCARLIVMLSASETSPCEALDGEAGAWEHDPDASADADRLRRGILRLRLQNDGSGENSPIAVHYSAFM